MAREAFIAEASKWGSPLRLAMLAIRERDETPREDFFKDPDHQAVEDAWQAAVFSLGYEQIVGLPIEVRLAAPEPFPDFVMRVGGLDVGFECVTVIRRRLGEQFRGDREKGPIPARFPENLPEFDVGPIRNAAAAKAARNYQPPVHLLVHIDTKGANASHQAAAEAAREGAGDAFESIWLIGFGRPSGTDGSPRWLILCAKESSVLARPTGWMEVRGIEVPRSQPPHRAEA
jgi:hypothetical protein